MSTKSVIPTEFISANAVGMTDIVAQGLTLGDWKFFFNPGL